MASLRPCRHQVPGAERCAPPSAGERDRTADAVACSRPAISGARAWLSRALARLEAKSTFFRTFRDTSRWRYISFISALQGGAPDTPHSYAFDRTT